MIPWLPPTRIVRGATDATVAWQFTDADGDPADPGVAAVAATAVRSDGTAVTLGAVSGTDSDPRTASVALAELDRVDWITVSWTLGGVAVGSEVVEVVGRPPLSPAAVRALDPSLNAKSDDLMRAAIRSVEDTATRAMHRSPFERFYRQRLDGSGSSTLVVAWPDLLELVWARVYSTATAYTSLTAGELAAVPAGGGPLLVRTDGGVWPRGCSNIDLGYRFGFSIPNDLRDKLVLAVRKALTQFATGIPDRAVSMQTVEGFNVQLATPGTRNWTTGVPEVDEALNSYRFDMPVIW